MKKISNKLTFKRGGCHPNPCKNTAGFPIVALDAPQTVTLMLSQSIGKPAVPVVNPGDRVMAGQMVAQADGFVSAPVHSPVCGKVRKIEDVRDSQGLMQKAIIIERTYDENPEDEAVSAALSLDPDVDGDGDRLLEKVFKKSVRESGTGLKKEDIVRIIGDAGVVGLGGATFPTRVKLTLREGANAEYLIINAAECEPYLTCDDSLMISHAKEIIGGVKLLMQAVGAPNAVIGIEDNKPAAAAALRDAIGQRRIQVETLRTRYPQGSEKQLIYALTGRIVPCGGLPIDVGCVVDNVATAFAVYQAVCRETPLTSRVVTVDGPSLRSPGNFLVPLGTPISAIIDAAGGIPEDTGKIIAGGPMMGRAVSNIDAPSTKGLSGLIVFPESMAFRKDEENCIRCARCVSACPMGLQPYLLGTLGEFELGPEAKAAGVMNCLECGCCAYVCPSHRRLIDYIRLAKSKARSC